MSNTGTNKTGVNYKDLLIAANHLHLIVNQASFVGSVSSALKTNSRAISNTVLDLIYGTMKCMCE
jgi:hypothetical protein